MFHAKQADSRTIRVARHSESAPPANAAHVCGISWTSAVANPRCWLPRTGASRRANATSEANPLPRRAAGTPAASSEAHRVAAHNAVARACAAAAADFNRSNRSTSARSAASPANGSISNKLSNMTPTLNHATDNPPASVGQPAQHDQIVQQAPGLAVRPHRVALHRSDVDTLPLPLVEVDGGEHLLDGKGRSVVVDVLRPRRCGA